MVSNRNSVRYDITSVSGAFAKQLRTCLLLNLSEWTNTVHIGRIFVKYLWIFTEICVPSSVYF